ncbi:hypothetical protein DFQ28_011592 [Apophysomyces sp. BC1034]|nr:hypothetical protein DFQ30_005887 [Apophysomyces sp. BC1015]KAG0181708.1 hypothetical protein DFQ29_007374 [Apophysomyces sp. BC1021]KAG0191550.1 hypothetical protein DFQ28_011592 [Apophysomyces sp. BC1034]
MPTDSKKRSRSDETVEVPKTKKQALEGGSVLDTILPITSVTKLVSEEDFRIIAGSYERVLYGINANWITSEKEKDTQTYKLELEPIFIVPAHTGCIRTVAVGRNFLASGSTDEIIRLYDVKKRKEYGSLGGHHQGDVTDIQFHGKYMLSASEDHTLCLWRTKDWEYLKTFKGHKGRINSVAIHPTGKIALSVASDKTVIVWNLMTARKASVNKLGRDEGLVVQWNNDGSKYAIMFDRKINIYNVSDAKVALTIEHRSRFLCMKYYYSSKTEKEYIITGSEDKIARIWDPTSGDCVAELTGHKLRVKTMSLIKSNPSADHSISVLITASSDGVIKCWDVEEAIAMENKEEIKPLGEYNTKSRITCCAVHGGFTKADAPAKDQE